MDLAYNSPWSFVRTSHLIVYLSVLADDITTLLLNESFFHDKKSISRKYADNFSSSKL